MLMQERKKTMTLFLIKKFQDNDENRTDMYVQSMLLLSSSSLMMKKKILQDVRMMINENENENKQRKIKSMWQVILHEFKKKL